MPEERDEARAQVVVQELYTFLEAFAAKHNVRMLVAGGLLYKDTRTIGVLAGMHDIPGAAGSECLGLMSAVLCAANLCNESVGDFPQEVLADIQAQLKQTTPDLSIERRSIEHNRGEDLNG